MNINNDDILAFYDTLEVIEEYRSLHGFSDKSFCSVSQRIILLYHYFEDIVNLHDYFNELNESFKKCNCFEKFLSLPLKIYFCYDFNEKNVFKFLH